MPSLDDLKTEAIALHRRVRNAEEDLEHLREQRAHAFQALKQAGVSNYQIGALVGITNVAVLGTLKRLKAAS